MRSKTGYILEIHFFMKKWVGQSTFKLPDILVKSCSVIQTCAEPWYNWFITFESMQTNHIAKYIMLNVGNFGYHAILYRWELELTRFNMTVNNFSRIFLPSLFHKQISTFRQIKAFFKRVKFFQCYIIVLSILSTFLNTDVMSNIAMISQPITGAKTSYYHLAPKRE